MSIKESDSVYKILFVCYGAGHVNMLVPLISKIQLDVKYEVTVLGLTTSGTVLKKHNISYIGFKDLINEGDQKALEYGEKLASLIPGGGAVSHEETVAYLGLSFFDLVNRYGMENAELRYENDGRQAFLPITIMERLFDRVQPNILVATNSPRAERAAFLVARDQKIPSICIVGLFAQHEIKWIGEPDYGSRICVLSQNVKQFFLSAGRYDSEVVVTGNPALDRLARPFLAKEAENFRNEKGWQNKKVILWASQPEPEKHPFTGCKADPALPRRVDEALLLAVAQHPDWQLVIRYHPGESINPADWPEQAYISTLQEDLAILLKTVDIVVTMTSTVGLEGVLLGKPLVTIEQSVFQKDAPYSQMGLSKGVMDLNDLESSIAELLEGKWRATAALPEVGKATDSICGVIEELLTG